MKNILIIIMVTAFLMGCNKGNRIEPTAPLEPTVVVQKVVGNISNVDALALLPEQYFTLGNKVIFKDEDNHELTFVIEDKVEKNVPFETDELKYSYDETGIYLVSEDQEKLLWVSARGNYSSQRNIEVNFLDVMLIHRGNPLGDGLNIELVNGELSPFSVSSVADNLELNNTNYADVYYMFNNATPGTSEIPFANIRFNTSYGVLAFDDLSNVTWYFDRIE